ncbi:protein-(glutamine-N5) methyltransferase, release factor-specific [Hoylesella oralis ATCC 33269]|uniref:peptide chain release factor N(5)-glutamine methyltransferase n=1 Tax=Hoylesella oralis ATCC 33269 TaxID=873533 RepID=E7RMB9_9BACT|nr:peptide chain release factor N(5)-glutamine methyltransferase [Hoylesella oralis]EFZ37900.1 protein-(glutamine-N5) methyltransferase, release factor-specific [Hoylesella oralis ATCC 33269]EPH17061.1 protein-(glutamine-N5) methyltransferase, release factor-specific [Hoylesella oralis HGA0225]SHF43520.1 release factor glutamine methyltransferase [Hoylesella oralis]
MTYNEIWQQLTPLYDNNEAKAIVRMLLEMQFGLSWADVICGKVTQLGAENALLLQQMIGRLAKGEPVQYVMGRAEFANRIFSVTQGVLIPRPETAELCAWITHETPEDATVLDVGCGSGCIAVTLALNIHGAHVVAWDISDEALHIAESNAQALHARVDIVRQDALIPPADVEKWDVVVSNPPYICERERGAMARNVLDYEPDTALFVPDNDPLLFYRAIAEYAAKALKRGGTLYFELNPLHADEVKRMLYEQHFAAIESRHDMFGKERFIKAIRY